MSESSNQKGGVSAADHQAEWKALASKELRGKDVDGLVWTSPDGLAVRALYTAEDLEGLEHTDVSLQGWRPHWVVGVSFFLVV